MPSNLELVETTAQPECGSGVWVRDPFDPCKWTWSIWYCRKHECLACARWRSSNNSHAVVKYVGTKPCHHVTLTVARTGKPLQALIMHLMNSFKRLIRRTVFRKSIIGGVRFLDCVYDAQHHRWGPHLHMILEAESVPLEWMKSEWYKITGDSWEVDVTAVPVEEGPRNIKIRYAAKVPYANFASDESLMREYLSVVKGKRKAQPFGRWYGQLQLTTRRR
jgi:Replication protein